MNKVNTNPTKPPVYPITTVPDTLPFQTITLNFITKLPESLGNDTILTIMDHDCSKASIFIPCKEAIDSEGVAKLYVQHMVCHYGLPKKIISDRDTQFTSNFTKCYTYGLLLTHTKSTYRLIMILAVYENGLGLSRDNPLCLLFILPCSLFTSQRF